MVASEAAREREEKAEKQQQQQVAAGAVAAAGAGGGMGAEEVARGVEAEGSAASTSEAASLLERDGDTSPPEHGAETPESVGAPPPVAPTPKR